MNEEKREEELKETEVSVDTELTEEKTADDFVEEEGPIEETTKDSEGQKESGFEIVSVDYGKVLCKKCKTEINGELYCPKCGKRVGQRPPRRKIAKKVLIPILAAGILVLAGAGFLLYNFVLVPYNQYSSANQCIQEKKYDEAIKIYTELGDYKDSKEKRAAACYEKGSSLLEKGEFDKAVLAYKESNKYKDSEECILKCYYEKGNAFISEKMYEEAIQAYKNAGDYQDASQKLLAAEEDKKFEELKKKLSDAFDDCESSDTSIASDGQSISIDSKNQYDYEGIVDMITIMAKFELPESLLNEMTNTTALMGMQTRTYENLEVSWSFHPDHGLDAIFKIKK